MSNILLPHAKACPCVQAEFEAALLELHDGMKLPVRYIHLNDAHTERVAVFEMERHWHRMQVRWLVS